MKAGWFRESCAPSGIWLRTLREGERGTNVCALRIWPDGTREWIESTSGITTITHHSFAAPTHWKHIGAEPMTEQHLGLPVAGYMPQSSEKVDLVNANKAAEERCLRILDNLATLPDTDKRWLAIGRTGMEKAWMAVNRSVFKPSRVELSGDNG